MSVEPKRLGSLLRVLLHGNAQLLHPVARDALWELERAVESKDSGRIAQVIAGINRRAQAEARTVEKGGRARISTSERGRNQGSKRSDARS